MTATYGAWPQQISYLSWKTQRLANRLPEYTLARKWSWSVLQQFLNPIASEIEETEKQILEERDNLFTSSANIFLLSQLYQLEFPKEISLTQSLNNYEFPVYEPPVVTTEINGTEVELKQAFNNELKYLYTYALPSRIEYGNEVIAYQTVIPETAISNLSSVVPNDLPLEGHLYITISNNSTWEYRGRDKIYFPKVYINGTTRKNTPQREAIPIRFNGTVKTINQWKSIDSIQVSYLDDAATIIVESLPFSRERILDTRSLSVSSNGLESWKFISFEDKVWGSVVNAEGYTVPDFDTVRLGFEELDKEYQIALLDNSSYLTITDLCLKPYTDYFLALTAQYLYVYTNKLPYPDLKLLDSETADSKIDLISDRWIYSADDLIRIETDILDISMVPYRYRWSIKKPSGESYYLTSDGIETINSEVWIENLLWSNKEWRETAIEFLPDSTGTFVVTLEAEYSSYLKDYSNNFVLTTKFVFYVPTIEKETKLVLPVELQNASKIHFDSDGRLWFLIGSNLLLGELKYDYFIMDYQNKLIFFKEPYSSVEVSV